MNQFVVMWISVAQWYDSILPIFRTGIRIMLLKHFVYFCTEYIFFCKKYGTIEIPTAASRLLPNGLTIRLDMQFG